MRRDWFGDEPGRRQTVQVGHAELDRMVCPTFTTGYWSHYYGDVRSIVAEDDDARPASLPSASNDQTRRRPVPTGSPRPTGRVEFFWKCGQPRFEGWVTWRDHANGGGGQVTVIFATPATPDQVLLRAAEEAEPALVDRTEKWQGMWVCSHSDHRQHVMITCLPTQLGDWIVPFDAVMYTEGVGPVGTWAPRFGSGGTPDHSDPFEPPPQF